MIPRVRGTALAVWCSVIACGSAGGQAWTRDWPQTGDPVRVSSATPALERARMTFQRQLGDTLVFSRSAGFSRRRVETSVALAEVTRLEMPGIPKTGHGRHTRGAIAGFVIVGLVTGAIMYSTADFSCRTTDTCSEFGPEFEQAARGVIGFLGGGVIGSVAGWTIAGHHANERWRTVHPKGSTLSTALPP